MNYAIGIDVGGTKMEGVLVDEKGKVIKRKRVLTEADKGKKHVINTLTSLIAELSTQKVLGVGIGMPGYIIKGKVAFSPNIACIEGVALPKLLAKTIDVPLYFENDANCFTIAESRWGAGKNSRNIVGIIVGTGVGSGMIVDGKLHLGANGGVELGHVKFPYEDFDIESLVSGPAIERRYQELSGKHKLTSEIFASQEKAAKQVMAETTEMLGWLCSVLINTMNPEMIIFGGGVSKLPLYADIRSSAKKYSLAENFDNCKIVKNKLGASSGVLGAASLVFEHKGF